MTLKLAKETYPSDNRNKMRMSRPERLNGFKREIASKPRIFRVESLKAIQSMTVKMHRRNDGLCNKIHEVREVFLWGKYAEYQLARSWSKSYQSTLRYGMNLQLMS